MSPFAIQAEANRRTLRMVADARKQGLRVSPADADRLRDDVAAAVREERTARLARTMKAAGGMEVSPPMPPNFMKLTDTEREAYWSRPVAPGESTGRSATTQSDAGNERLMSELRSAVRGMNDMVATMKAMMAQIGGVENAGSELVIQAYLTRDS